jgi:flagellar biosynthesis/type III secretory pathway chaperone
LAKDLRNESLRKEIERIKKMNQMNEQLFIGKQLFLMLNKMLAVIRLSTNSRSLNQQSGTTSIARTALQLIRVS